MNAYRETGTFARASRIALAFVAGAACATGAAAQPMPPSPASVVTTPQFNFASPGARSLALAGALTGAGDDATGAWTNPAGLTNVTRPEVGVEFRGFDYTTLFVRGGRFESLPVNLGVDTVAGLSLGEGRGTTRGLSFASVVVPRSRLAFAAYRTEVANFATTSQTDGVFFEDAGELYRIYPVDGSASFGVVGYGGSVAARLADNVSVGAGVTVYDLAMRSTTRRYNVNGSALTQPGGPFGPPLRTADNLRNSEVTEGDDVAPGINVGVSYDPTSRIRLGASYRSSPSFSVDYRRASGTGAESPTGESRFRLPDVLSVGMLVRLADYVNATIDYRRVGYSRLTEHAIGPDDVAADFGVRDGHEVRGAVEVLVPFRGQLLAVRGGVWRDPDHQIRYRGTEIVNRVLDQPGRDEVHVTGGTGLVLDAVQIDAAYDYSRGVKTFALSAIYRF
jgi:long-chain fatty acid transport protein